MTENKLSIAIDHICGELSRHYAADWIFIREVMNKHLQPVVDDLKDVITELKASKDLLGTISKNLEQQGKKFDWVTYDKNRERPVEL